MSSNGKPRDLLPTGPPKKANQIFRVAGASKKKKKELPTAQPRDQNPDTKKQETADDGDQAKPFSSMRGVVTATSSGLRETVLADQQNEARLMWSKIIAQKDAIMDYDMRISFLESELGAFKTNNEVLQKELTRLNEAHATALEKLAKLEGSKKHSNSAASNAMVNMYEYKLTDALQRYDHAHESAVDMQRRWTALFEAQKTEHEAQMRERDAQMEDMEQSLNATAKRLQEEVRNNEMTYKISLQQQESEYEAELKLIMTATQRELMADRERREKMQGWINNQAGKYKGLEEKLEQARASVAAKDELLKTAKEKQQWLHATIENFKRQIVARDGGMKDQENAMKSLRRENKTLTNFKFILQTMTDELTAEQKPVKEMIQHLQLEATEMFIEMDQANKQRHRADVSIREKDHKIRALESTSQKFQGQLRAKSAYIQSFKHDLSLIVRLTVPKDIEHAVRTAYQRYVLESKHGKTAQLIANPTQKTRAPESGDVAKDDFDKGMDDENDGQDNDAIKGGELSEAYSTLQENAKQAACYERRASSLRHRIDTALVDSTRAKVTHLAENAWLLDECNRLRVELSDSKRGAIPTVVPTMRESRRGGVGALPSTSSSNNGSLPVVLAKHQNGSICNSIASRSLAPSAKGNRRLQVKQDRMMTSSLAIREDNSLDESFLVSKTGSFIGDSFQVPASGTDVPAYVKTDDADRDKKTMMALKNDDAQKRGGGGGDIRKTKPPPMLIRSPMGQLGRANHRADTSKGGYINDPHRPRSAPFSTDSVGRALASGRWLPNQSPRLSDGTGSVATGGGAFMFDERNLHTNRPQTSPTKVK